MSIHGRVPNHLHGYPGNLLPTAKNWGELLRLCSAGRVYDVERWIQAGRPIQAITYKRPRKPSVVRPLRAAIRKKHVDLAQLLLCNGYRLDLEPSDWESVLDEAMKIRAFDLLDLLLKWGADPTKVRNYNVVKTYKTDLIDKFWTAGVDYTADPEFVLSLARTVNKPLYGWLRRNRADPRLQAALDVALLEALVEDEELPVRLLLWAGADPHRKVPMARDLGRPNAWDADAVFSSAEAAITFGRLRLFDLLRVEAMPGLDTQAASAHDSWMLKKVVALRPPSDWSEAILAFIRQSLLAVSRGLVLGCARCAPFHRTERRQADLDLARPDPLLEKGTARGARRR